MKRDFSQRCRNSRIVITVLSIIACGLIFFLSVGRNLFSQSDGAASISGRSLNADRLISATISRLNRLHSISAEIAFRLNLFSTEYTGTGQYEELASPSTQKMNPNSPLTASQFRLHLKVSPPEDTPIQQEVKDNILEIVCAPDSLWTYTCIEEVQTLTEINLTELNGFLSQLSESEQKTLASQGLTLPASIGNFPCLGGIAGLLTALRERYDFDPKPEDVSFSSGSFPVWKLTGRLKPKLKDSIQKWLNSDEKTIEMARIPGQVEIYIGQKTPFPFRIAYSSVIDEGRGLTDPIITIDFVRVYENLSSVTANHFVYAPKINSTRITKDYLKKLIPGIEF